MPAHKYQTIIFDCDGVLVDTEGLKFIAWQQALAEIGIVFSEEDYMPLVGKSSQAIANSIQQNQNMPFDLDILIRKKDEIYHTRQAQGVEVFPEALDYLKNLIEHKTAWGIKIALVSSAAHHEIRTNLQHLKVEESSFDAIFSGKDDLKSRYPGKDVNKPFPYIYQLCAEQLNTLAENCLVFEDTAAGVQSALGAGMEVIAIPNKYTLHHDFTGATLKYSFSEIVPSEWIEVSLKKVALSSLFSLPSDSQNQKSNSFTLN